MNIETSLLHCLGRAEFMARATEANPAADAALLAARWLESRVTIRKLRSAEPGCADDAAVLPVPPTMADQVRAVVDASAVQAAFSTTPVAFGLIDADAVIPSRSSVWSERLTFWRRSLAGRTEDDLVLAGVCLPAGACEAASPAPVHAARLGGRLLLLDGHHRVRVLASMGVRYVPCIISVCTGFSDVRRLAPWLTMRKLRDRLGGPRPPLLRDYLRRSLVFDHPPAQ